MALRFPAPWPRLPGSSADSQDHCVLLPLLRSPTTARLPLPHPAPTSVNSGLSQCPALHSGAKAAWPLGLLQGRCPGRRRGRAPGEPDPRDLALCLCTLPVPGEAQKAPRGLKGAHLWAELDTREPGEAAALSPPCPTGGGWAQVEAQPARSHPQPAAPQLLATSRFPPPTYRSPARPLPGARGRPPTRRAECSPSEEQLRG